jgi:hypothetical protein
VPLRCGAGTSGGNQPLGRETQNFSKERTLIHITANPSTDEHGGRGRRVADYLHVDCTALFVHQTPELSQLPAEEREAVEKHLRFARSPQIETRIHRNPFEFVRLLDRM